MSQTSANPPEGDSSRGDQRLSYKFQRLRERLREAIASGELQGKLPGERQLAWKFRVNAKTLSKALTDLAAEGLLDRSIGRGTYVRGADAPRPAPTIERWMLLCDESQRSAPLVRKLCAINPNCEVVSSFVNLRPSFLNQFKVAVNCSDAVPDSMLRDLMIRNISVVQAGHAPGIFSTHAVVVDRVLGVSLLARDMLVAGHRHFAVVEPRGQVFFTETVRAAARHATMDVAVDSVDASQILAVLQAGATAVICGDVESAREARAALTRAGVAFPGRVAMGAVGMVEQDPPCSGYYVDPSQMADTIVHVIRERLSNRPALLWLAGQFADAGTMSLSIHPASVQAPAVARPSVGDLHS